MSFGKFKDSTDNTSSILGAAQSESDATPGQTQSAAGSAKSDAILGVGTKIVGTLTFNGPVELGGEVEGEIFAQDKLIIAETATIKAKIHGTDVLVRGTVTEDIEASERLVLHKPARVHGNINCARLSMEEGVLFEGNCAMGKPTR